MAAQLIGTPVQYILQSVGLPTLLTDDAELLLPELPCWHFVQKVARQEAMSTFGLFAAKTMPDTFAGALREVIKSYLGNTDPKIELLARAMGINVRTLQRRLDSASKHQPTD